MRLTASIPDPLAATPQVVGVDECAQGRGRIYGTMVVDVDTSPGGPVAGLRGRHRAPWPAKRPEVEIIGRDRATYYATRTTPEPLRIADRWHLRPNLGEAAEKSVYRHRGCLRPVSAPPADPSVGYGHVVIVALADRPPVRRTHTGQTRHHPRAPRRRTQRSVARQLGMSLNTILRFSRATAPEDLFTGQWQGRLTKLNTYAPYLDQRWRKAAPTPGCRGRRSRNRATRTATATFARLQGNLLPQSIEAATVTDLPSLHRFAQHLERDRPRRRDRRPLPALGLRGRRRPCQPDQDAQAPVVRPRRIRTPPPTGAIGVMPAAARIRGACSVTNEPDVPMGVFLRDPAQGSYRVNPGATSRCGQTVQLRKQHGKLPGVKDGVRERAHTGEHGELRPVDLCERLVPGDAMLGPGHNGPGLVTNLQVDHHVKLSPREPTAHPISPKPGSAGSTQTAGHASRIRLPLALPLYPHGVCSRAWLLCEGSQTEQSWAKSTRRGSKSASRSNQCS